MEEEQAVDVMLDRVADRGTEREQKHLRDREEGGAEDDVANRPTVIERAEDKHELRDRVDDCADERPEYVDDPKANRFRVAEAGVALECRNGKEEAESEKHKGGDTDELRKG